MSSNLSESQLKELFKNRKFDPSLRSVSGKRVEIIQTGEANSDTGPDFKHALVKIDGVTMRGDVELHRKSSDWYSHNHHSDRNYNSVVLHVVVECDGTHDCATESGRRIETLELSKFLSAEATKFLTGLNSEERIIALKCADENSQVSFKEKMDYLNFLGEKRFMHKVNKFEERLKDIIDENRPVVFEAKQKYFRDFSELLIEHKTYEKSELQGEAYWDQLLYEGIFEGLGYSKNTAAFRKLARNVSLSFLSEHSNGDRSTVEAILFGAANLLPQDVHGFDEESKIYCEKLDSIWLQARKKYKHEYVDGSEWFFFKLRPQNFPSLRIAGASYMLTNKRSEFSAKELISSAASKDDRGLLLTWRKFLVVPSQDYWTRHFVFGAAAVTKVKMLIGAGRAEEIIINTVLPLTYLRGKIFDQPALQEQSLRIYSDHRPTTDNNITLLVKESFFGGDNVFSTVLAQQGALHLYRTLCSERRCARCKIGKNLYGKKTAV